MLMVLLIGIKTDICCILSILCGELLLQEGPQKCLLHLCCGLAEPMHQLVCNDFNHKCHQEALAQRPLLTVTGKVSQVCYVCYVNSTNAQKTKYMPTSAIAA